MTKTRVATIDIAKGFGMMIVVMFHAEIFSGIWTQFHMPLFAFLSGFVYREKYNTSVKQAYGYIKKKIAGCYVPFVVYNFVFLLMHNLLYRAHIYGELSNGKLYTAKDFLKQTISIATMGGGESLPGPMWYLIAMLEFTVIYALIRLCFTKCIKNEKVRNIIITAVCTVFLFIGFSQLDLPRMLNRALVLLFYYNLGYMIFTYLPDAVDTAFDIKNLVISVVAFVILLIGMRGGADWPAFSWIVVPSGVAGIAITLFLSNCLDKYTRIIRSLFIYIGKHTIFILGTQYLCFKAGNALQVVCQGRDITWLGMYGVESQEQFGWKLIYFLCGLGIPLGILKAKDFIKDIIKKIGK